MPLSAEERAIRKGRISASVIADIAGISPWRGPIDAWLELTGRTKRDERPAQSHGHRLESAIVDMWCEATGHETAYFGTVVHPREDWACATPDRAIFGRRAVLEVKLVGGRMAHHWDDGPPDYVISQLAWQLACCDADEGHVAALIGGTEFKRWVIARDPALEADLVEIGREFYFRHVTLDDPPPVDEHASKRALATLYPHHGGELAPAPAEALGWVKQYLRARQEEADAKARKEQAQMALCGLIGTSAGIVGEGFRATWKEHGPIDVPAFTRAAGRSFRLDEIKPRAKGRAA